MRNFSTILACSLSVFLNCVDPIEIDNIDRSRSVPVIEGFITDQPGPHTIKLSYSTEFTDRFYTPITGASVVLSGSDNHQERFVELTEGTYISSTSFSAIPGTVYTLEISIGEDTYLSSEVGLKKGQPLNAIEFREDAIPSLNYYGDIKYVKGVRLFAPIKNHDKTENYYSYKVIPTYLFEAERADENGPNRWCYVTISDKTFNILKDRKGGFNHDISFYGFSDKFLHTFSFLVQQYSMTKEAYDFWEKVKNMLANTGGLFDRPPFTIRGNMRHRSDETKEMLGLFSVYSLTEKRVFIHGYNLSYIPFIQEDYCFPLFPPVPPECLDCRKKEGGRAVTNTKPDWWP